MGRGKRQNKGEHEKQFLGGKLMKLDKGKGKDSEKGVARWEWGLSQNLC